jgi:hypothetical protein
MNEWKDYIKQTRQPMRPYVPGESLEGISVWEGDTPEAGGMIAINPKDSTDQWYVAKAFFEENYRPAD